MECEAIIIHLINYLREHDYPENSIVTDYRVKNSHYRTDLAVIDPQTNTPLIVFVVKSEEAARYLKRKRKQAHKFHKQLCDFCTFAYFVLPKDTEPYFEIIRVPNDAYTIKQADNITLIDYKSVRNSVLCDKANLTEEKKKKAVDNFWLLSRILAIATILLFLIKKIFTVTIDSTDITLIGGFIILTLIPYASKVRFFGIEFERLSKAKNDK